MKKQISLISQGELTPIRSGIPLLGSLGNDMIIDKLYELPINKK